MKNDNPISGRTHVHKNDPDMKARKCVGCGRKTTGIAVDVTVKRPKKIGMCGECAAKKGL